MSRKEGGEARRQSEDAAFRRDRLQTAVVRLRERRDELREQEEDERRRVAYDKAKTERDKLAAELADTYPAIARQLSESDAHRRKRPRGRVHKCARAAE